MTSNQYRFGRWVTGIIVSSSVSRTVREVIKNNVENETLYQSLQTKIATMVIGGIVADYGWEVTKRRMDEIMAWFVSAQMAAEEVKKEDEAAKKEEEEKKDPNVIMGEIVEDNGN